jgi:hypothetical protein
MACALGSDLMVFTCSSSPVLVGFHRQCRFADWPIDRPLPRILDATSTSAANSLKNWQNRVGNHVYRTSSGRDKNGGEG